MNLRRGLIAFLVVVTTSAIVVAAIARRGPPVIPPGQEPIFPPKPPPTWNPQPNGECSVIPLVLPPGDPCDKLKDSDQCRPVPPSDMPFLLLSIMQAEYHGSTNCDADNKWDKRTSPPTPPRVDPGWQFGCNQIATATICRWFFNRDFNKSRQGFKCSQFNWDNFGYDSITDSSGQRWCHVTESTRCKLYIQNCVESAWQTFIRIRRVDGSFDNQAVFKYCNLNGFHWGHERLPGQTLDPWFPKNTPKERRDPKIPGYDGPYTPYYPLPATNEDWYWKNNPSFDCMPMSGLSKDGSDLGGPEGTDGGYFHED